MPLLDAQMRLPLILVQLIKENTHPILERHGPLWCDWCHAVTMKLPPQLNWHLGKEEHLASLGCNAEQI